MGVLYLENNLAHDVFTLARVELCSLLSSQTAIAIENALLYRDVREVTAELQRSNEMLEKRRSTSARRSSTRPWWSCAAHAPSSWQARRVTPTAVRWYQRRSLHAVNGYESRTAHSGTFSSIILAFICFLAASENGVSCDITTVSFCPALTTNATFR
jgi:hypothetical protein